MNNFIIFYHMQKVLALNLENSLLLSLLTLGLLLGAFMGGPFK